jgi:hypothetical protein
VNGTPGGPSIYNPPRNRPILREVSAPRDGYLEPYGDYFEIDIDGGGRSHILWGEGPSYQGPGNVWYTNR